MIFLLLRRLLIRPTNVLYFKKASRRRIDEISSHDNSTIETLALRLFSFLLHSSLDIFLNLIFHPLGTQLVRWHNITFLSMWDNERERVCVCVFVERERKRNCLGTFFFWFIRLFIYLFICLFVYRWILKRHYNFVIYSCVLCVISSFIICFITFSTVHLSLISDI